jgi:hypothetical protein
MVETKIFIFRDDTFHPTRGSQYFRPIVGYHEVHKMIQFLEFLQLKELVNAFYRVSDAFHDIRRTFARCHIPGPHDFEETRFIDAGQVVLGNEVFEFIFVS